MKISEQELIEMDAPPSLIKRFAQVAGETDATVEIADLIGGKNTYKDLLWIAVKKGLYHNLTRFACDCALINTEIIKQHFTRGGYKHIIAFLNNPYIYPYMTSTLSMVDTSTLKRLTPPYDDLTSEILAPMSDAVIDVADEVRTVAESIFLNTDGPTRDASASLFWAASTVESVIRLLAGRQAMVDTPYYACRYAVAAGASENKVDDLMREMFKGANK